MIYIAINDNGEATGYGTDPALFDGGPTLLSRWDYTSFEQVTKLAQELTAAIAGELFLPTDAGEYVSPRYVLTGGPRYDVIKAPKVGDEVSCAFNGDYYICGKIINISPSYRVITTDCGKTFYRKRLTAKWLYNKTWALVNGHHNTKNPEF